MKLSKNILTLVFALFSIVFAEYVHAERKTYAFRVTQTRVDQVMEGSINELINYTTGTTAFPDTKAYLFGFIDNDPNTTDMKFYREKGTDRVCIEFLSNSRNYAYNLYHTKARVEPGSNVIQLDVYDDHIWLTVGNKIENHNQLVTGSDKGEGILIEKRILENFTLANLRLAVTDPLVDRYEVTSIPLEVTGYSPGRRLSSHSPIYDRYGYGDEPEMLPQQLGNSLGFNSDLSVSSLHNHHGFPAGNSPYSIEVWIKPTVHASRTIMGWGMNIELLQEYIGIGQINALKLETNGRVVNQWFGNDLTVTSGNLADGSWHHLAATFDGTTRKIYVDGVLKGQDNPTGHNVPVNNWLEIGSMPRGYLDVPTYFDGSIDELSIWSTARTVEQIKADMYLGPDGHETGLVAYYPFDQGTACGNNTQVRTVVDKSGHGHTGTIFTSHGLLGTVANWLPGVIPPYNTTVCHDNVVHLGSYTTGGTWASSNASIATVNSNGEVIGIAEGEATITYNVTNSGGCVNSWPAKVKVLGDTRVFGNGLDFDGIDDYVSVKPVSYTQGNAYTLEAWVKPDISKTSLLFIWGRQANPGFNHNVLILYQDGSLANISSNGSNFNTPVGSLLADGAWHHVAASYDGTTGYIYVDGVLMGTGSFSGTQPPSGLGEYIIGQNFDGRMDEVRVWSTSRTVAQIRNNMYGELIGNEPGLTAYYNFNAGKAGGNNNSPLYDKTISKVTAIPMNFAMAGHTSNYMPGAPVTLAPDIKKALSFDGVDDYVNIDNTLGNFGTGDFTVEFNVKTSMTDRAYLISKRNLCEQDHFWNVVIGNGKIEVEMSQNGTNYVHIASTISINDGKWHHVALVRSSGIFHIFIDSVNRGSIAAATNINNTYMLQLGTSICNGANGSKKIAGIIDELRFWNVARTATQIQSGMNKEMVGNETGLQAYYTFNQGKADGTNTGINYLVDKSVNRRSGVLNNFALTGTTSNWVMSNIANKATELCMGDAIQFNSNVPHGLWSSSNPGIATVDSTGLVTSVANGTAAISYHGVNSGGCESYNTTNVEVVAPVVYSNTGNSLHFDGVNDYVDINTILGNFGTGDFTVEFKVKTSMTDRAYLISKRNICNNGYYWNLQISNGDIDVEMSENGANYVHFSRFANISDGNWHHVVLLRRSGMLHLYVDDNHKGSTVAYTDVNSSHMLQLGTNVCNGINGSKKFAGTIDELRFWNVARTVPQLVSEKNKELVGDEAGLLAYYPMNQGAANGNNTSVTQLTDATTLSPSHGMLHNFALAGTASNWVPGELPITETKLCLPLTMQLNAPFTGATWWSSNSAVATVSSTGVVTAVAKGGAEIYATYPSNGGCVPVATTSIDVVRCGQVKGAPENDNGDGRDVMQHDFLESLAKENRTTVQVVPNPNTGSFRVLYHLNASSPVEIKLLDIQGRTVHTAQLRAAAGSNQQTVQTMNLNAGIYFLKISTDEFSKIEKVMIQN